VVVQGEDRLSLNFKKNLEEATETRNSNFEEDNELKQGRNGEI
jgi:hypothetical protein